MKFTIGGVKFDRLEVNILGYSSEMYDNPYDANCLSATACISVGGFSGSISLTLLATELSSFSSQASELYKSLIGEAVFCTIEDQLTIKLVGDGKGHIEVSGHVKDAVGHGYNTLVYEFSIDQTDLRIIVTCIGSILKKYPVRKI